MPTSKRPYVVVVCFVVKEKAVIFSQLVKIKTSSSPVLVSDRIVFFACSYLCGIETNVAVSGVLLWLIGVCLFVIL